MEKLGWITLAVLAVALLSLWSAISKGGVFRRVHRLATAGVLGAIGVLLAALYGSLSACIAFSGEALVGTVRTRATGPQAFELVYEPAKEAPPSAVTKMQLRGDQWRFSGAVVKWHPLFSVFGVRSYHRPLSISGQFSSLEKEASQRPTVEAIGPGRDKLWEMLYWVGPKLPFIEAVYGSAAYGYVDPRSVHEVYVTPSGYMIKRKTRG